MAAFIFAIRSASGRLVRSWVERQDWDDIDARIEEVKAENPGMTVECVEDEIGCVCDDREYHEAA